MASTSWENLNVGENNNDGPKVDFIKIGQGTTRMRIVSQPCVVQIHWEETSSGSRRKVICPGAGCPICAAGKASQRRYQLYVIDRSDAKLKVMEQGPSVISKLKQYTMDEDYGNPVKYDIKITKTGSGKETRYNVVASPNKTPITEEEKALVQAAPELDEINKPKTIEEILEMDLKCLADKKPQVAQDDDFGWDEPTTQSKPAASNNNSNGFDDDDWGSSNSSNDNDDDWNFD